MTLRATLITDGTSDIVLVPVLQWLMRQLTPEDFEIRWADPRAFPEKPRSLAERMQEAWLLHDEAALREAAGRPSGTEDLGLPAHRWDRLADPKKVLYKALRAANGAKGRRAKSFRPGRAAHRLADLISDWTPLRTLAAFAQLETDTRTALAQLGVVVADGT